MRTLFTGSWAVAVRDKKKNVSVSNGTQVSRRRLQLEGLREREEFGRAAEVFLFCELSGWGESITKPGQLVFKVDWLVRNEADSPAGNHIFVSLP